MVGWCLTYAVAPVHSQSRCCVHACNRHAYDASSGSASQADTLTPSWPSLDSLAPLLQLEIVAYWVFNWQLSVSCHLYKVLFCSRSCSPTHVSSVSQCNLQMMIICHARQVLAMLLAVHADDDNNHCCLMIRVLHPDYKCAQL